MLESNLVAIIMFVTPFACELDYQIVKHQGLSSWLNDISMYVATSV